VTRFAGLAVPATLALAGCAAVVPGASAPGPQTLAQAPAQAPAQARGQAQAPVQSRRSEPIRFSGELTQGGWIKGVVPPGTRSLVLDDRPVSFDEDGNFFIAFDRDAKPSARLVASGPQGTSESALAIAPRAWRIEHVNASPTGSAPSAAFLALRKPELARIAAARARSTGAQGWRQAFAWPAQGRISGRFGSQRIYRGQPGSYHSGLDIAGPTGTQFVAPADGVVILAAEQPFTLEGKLLMIDHGMGLNSAFLHCSELLVREGETVRQGQPIGRIGMTGRASGPHLHWSVKWNDARLDPILLTGPMR